MKGFVLPELELMLSAAEAAGRVAMPFFHKGGETSARVTMKPGNSPVTDADFAANAALRTMLQSARTEYGWISEEDEDSGDRLQKQRIFVVDPIDGTRAFIAGKPEWCVSLGLVEGGKAIAGVIHLPALGLTYKAALGSGSYRNDQKLVCSSIKHLRRCSVAGPKPIYEHLNRHADETLTLAPRVPSLAYRLAKAASGEVDLAIASTGAHDWDIAAADIILSEAGAVLTDERGESLTYNRSSLARGILLAGPSALVLAAAHSLGLHTEPPDGRRL
jgi:myo-inositol-1(or 4)-monophosphatase